MKGKISLVGKIPLHSKNKSTIMQNNLISDMLDERGDLDYTRWCIEFLERLGYNNNNIFEKQAEIMSLSVVMELYDMDYDVEDALSYYKHNKTLKDKSFNVYYVWFKEYSGYLGNLESLSLIEQSKAIKLGLDLYISGYSSSDASFEYLYSE